MVLPEGALVSLGTAVLFSISDSSCHNCLMLQHQVHSNGPNQRRDVLSCSLLLPPHFLGLNHSVSLRGSTVHESQSRQIEENRDQSCKRATYHRNADQKGWIREIFRGLSR